MPTFKLNWATGKYAGLQDTGLKFRSVDDKAAARKADRMWLKESGEDSTAQSPECLRVVRVRWTTGKSK